MTTLFLGNLRGWQLIIIVLTILCMFIVPFLLGLRIGRGKRSRR